MQKHFDLENEGQCQGEKRNLRHSTGNVRFHTGDFSRTLATWQNTFMQKKYPHRARDSGDDYR